MAEGTGAVKWFFHSSSFGFTEHDDTDTNTELELMISEVATRFSITPNSSLSASELSKKDLEFQEHLSKIKELSKFNI